jgi:hypothetical protein
MAEMGSFDEEVVLGGDPEIETSEEAQISEILIVPTISDNSHVLRENIITPIQNTPAYVSETIAQTTSQKPFETVANQSVTDDDSFQTPEIEEIVPEILNAEEIIAEETPKKPVIEEVSQNTPENSNLEPQIVGMETEPSLTTSVPLTPEMPSRQADVRSYYKDMNHVMQTAQTGTLASALQESREIEAEEESRSVFSRKNILFVIFGIVLFIISLLIISYSLFQNAQKQFSENTRVSYSIVQADANREVDTTGDLPFQIEAEIAEVLKQNTNIGLVDNIYLTEIQEGKKARLGTDDFFEKLKIALPATLSQTMQDEFMLGSYRAAGETYPFLVFRIDSFDQGFSGMHEWEERLLDDLKGVFAIPAYRLTPESFQEPLIDRVLQNTSTRVLLETTEPVIEKEITEILTDTETIETVDNFTEDISIIPERFIAINQSAILVLYSFINENTLVVTTHPDALLEVKKRLADQQIFQ